MIEIRKIENDFINKLTVATVDIYEVLSGIQRLRDTFVIQLDGVLDISDSSLVDLIYGKLSDIGYEVVVQTNAPYTPPAATPTDPAGNESDPIPAGQ
jgi:hypothetical protein